MHTAAYVRNRVTSAGADRTPFEMMYGRKPSVAHLRRVGERCVSLNRATDKLSPKWDVDTPQIKRDIAC